VRARAYYPSSYPSFGWPRLRSNAGEDILNKMVETAKGGDLRAADLVPQRIWPVRKGRPLSLSLPLPLIKTAADVVKALGTVADLVGAGEVTPDEGAALAAIFESKRRAIETVDLEARLSALEQERK
jgi:hypothetical protein